MNFLYPLFLSLFDFYIYKHIRKKSYYLLIFGPLSRLFLEEFLFKNILLAIKI